VRHSLILREGHKTGRWGEYLNLNWRKKGVWRKLHNEEFHNLCFLPNTIKKMKSYETGGACWMHVREVHTKFWWKELKEWVY
jgi:hypothetical protein